MLSPFQLSGLRTKAEANSPSKSTISQIDSPLSPSPGYVPIARETEACCQSSSHSSSRSARDDRGLSFLRSQPRPDAPAKTGASPLGLPPQPTFSETPSLLSGQVSPLSPPSYQAASTSFNINRSPTTSSLPPSELSLPALLFPLTDLEVLSRQSRVWGQGYLEFDWRLSEKTKFVVDSALLCLKRQVDMRSSARLVEGIET